LVDAASYAVVGPESGGAGSGIQTRLVSAAVGRRDGQRPFQLGPCFARADARRRGHRRRFARLSRYSALYLENNLAHNVFSTTRIAVLKLLASQAATAVENFRLYRDLAAREAKIRRLVDANIISIMVADDGGVKLSRPTTRFCACWATTARASTPAAFAGRK
jgi:hypothetical protein